MVQTHRKQRRDNVVKWGILSTARIGLISVVPAILNTAEAKLEAVASRGAEKLKPYLNQLSKDTGKDLESVKMYKSYEELLNDPEIDAVYIPLPNSLHAEWTIKAAKAGKHVLCEKPAAIDALEARRIIDFCEDSGVFFMEAFMYQFHPQYDRIKTIISEGHIGEPKLIRSAFSFPLPDKANIRYSETLAGGSLMDVGCYCVHSARLIFDQEPVTVAAQAELENNVDTSMVGILNFPNGKVASFDVSFDAAPRQCMDIVGTEGVITVRRPWKAEDAPAELIIGGRVGYGEQDGAVKETLPFVSAYELQVKAFCDAVLAKQPLPVDPEDAYKNMRVMDALQKAVRVGKWVEVL